MEKYSFEDCIDGFIKITIPSIGIITYAIDMDDALIAIDEAIKSYDAQLEKYDS